MRGAAGVLLLALLGACGDDIQFAHPPGYDPEASEGSDTSGRMDPHAGLPGGHPALPSGGGETPVPSHGAAPGAGANPHGPGAPPMGPEGDEVLFTGTVTMAPDFSPPPGFTLYVNMGRPPAGRPAVLSRRYENPSFPLEFELRRRDLAFGDTDVEGELVPFLILSEGGGVLDRSGRYVRTTPGAPVTAGSGALSLVLEEPEEGR